MQQTARRIQAAVRWPELVVRHSGEVFLVVLPGVALVDALARAERIRAAMEAPFPFESEELRSTVSIGGAPLGEPSEAAIREALRVAEDNLALAKQRGRNQVVG